MAKGKRPEMNLTFEARKHLGGVRKSGSPLLSQAAFGELFGRDESTIWRREDSENVEDTAAAIYAMILRISDLGIASQALETLRSIPQDERSEARGLTELTLILFNRGLVEEARSAAGATGGGEGDVMAQKDLGTKIALNTLQRMREAFKSQAARTKDAREAGLWDSASRGLAQVMSDVESAKESKDEPSEENSPEAKAAEKTKRPRRRRKKGKGS